MRRVLQSRRLMTTVWCRCIGLGGLVVFAMTVAHPSFAQTSSPEIAAKEKSDPAAGEVVVINRKKNKGSAPNPYAPIKLKPLPEKWSDTKQPAKKAIKEATAKPKAPKPVAVTRATENDPAPPLPTLNTEQRTASARLRQFPQAGLRSEPEQTIERSPPRRKIRRSARDRADWRRYRDSRRQSYRNRPWRQCRRLARRCQSGFEGSCYIWQRRCT